MIEILLLFVRLKMDELIQFLKERGVPEQNLSEIECEKVSNIVMTFPMLMGFIVNVFVVNIRNG